MNPKMLPLHLIIDDAGRNTLAALGDRLVLQYRSGPLTPAFLDATEGFFPAWTSRLEGGTFGCFAVIADDVGITEETLRNRQRATIGQLLSLPGAAMVTCMLGDSIQASANRAMGRLLLLGRRNIHHASTPREGAALMARHLGGSPSAAEIMLALDRIMAGTEGLSPWKP